MALRMPATIRRGRVAAAARRGPSPAAGALALAREAAAPGLRNLLGWQVARLATRLAFVVSLAASAGRMIADGALAAPLVAGSAAALLLSSAAALLAERGAARTLEAVSGELRRRARHALAEKPLAHLRARPSGTLLAGLQRHPDALASLVVTHAAARATLAIGPALALAAIACISWQAALVLLVCLPVMIVFFVLVGAGVRVRAAAQEKAFGRLAGQFTDRIRVMPTVLANHALRQERGKLEARMAAYADSTMAVLRIAFLNAGIVDLFAALSIALLAVLLGLGHLGLLHIPGFHALHLWQSLLILAVAAELFTPLRRYAEQYHVKAEGEAAAAELDWYVTPPLASAVAAWDGSEAIAARCGALAASLPDTGLVVIEGPSGAGKSTLLRLLAGLDPDAAAPAAAFGRGCEWISTDIHVPAGTLAQALAGNATAPDSATLRMAAARLGLTDGLLPGGLEARIAEGGANLSGGQRMRIGVARALLSDRPIIADEPTAKLDAASAAAVRDALLASARHRLVVAATHDPALVAAARPEHRVSLWPRGSEAIAA
jgi:ATP-binding cassette subfamily C protein